MNEVTACTVAPFVSGSINARDLLQLEHAILASLSVRTTAGLFRVWGRDLGVLDASGESLALLFVRVRVLVDESEAEETAEVARVLR